MDYIESNGKEGLGLRTAAARVAGQRHCELYRLPLDDFHTIMKSYPEVWELFVGLKKVRASCPAEPAGPPSLCAQLRAMHEWTAAHCLMHHGFLSCRRARCSRLSWPKRRSNSAMRSRAMLTHHNRHRHRHQAVALIGWTVRRRIQAARRSASSQPEAAVLGLRDGLSWRIRPVHKGRPIPSRPACLTRRAHREVRWRAHRPWDVLGRMASSRSSRRRVRVMHVPATATATGRLTHGQGARRPCCRTARLAA